jgi:prepilin-type N-terminal cleavage/methylation domain-containing protein
MPPCPRHGFTLIELSIVLVIIGLVVGGVLFGRDLIEAARIRQQISQIEQFKVAVNTFRGKYNCLPGDCPHATDFFGAIDPDFETCIVMTSDGTLTCNGTGDGKILGDLNLLFAVPNSRYWEIWHAWVQLSAAGFVSGNFTGRPGACGNVCARPGLNIPTLKNGMGTGVQMSTFSPGVAPGGQGNGFFLAAPDPNNSGNMRVPIFTTEDAFQIDSKTDDGLPATGRTRYFYTGYTTECTTDTDTYNIDQTYKLTAQGVVCALFFIGGF